MWMGSASGFRSCIWRAGAAWHCCASGVAAISTGILRANLLSATYLFMFDAALVGLISAR